MLFDYILSFILIAGLIYNLYLIIHQNKQIKYKGKEDFFVITMILLFCIIVTYSFEDATIIELIRNILVYGYFFSTLAIKRGITEDGIISLYKKSKWNEIKKIEVSEYQPTKAQIYYYTENHKYKLIFHKYQLKDVLEYIDKSCDCDIKIQKELLKK